VNTSEICFEKAIINSMKTSETDCNLTLSGSIKKDEKCKMNVY
jgi:hypothetical protein